jgi:hypothetical protein
MGMRTTITVLALAVAACESTGTDESPWLTYPGYTGHSQYFPLVGTVHDAPIDCDACHGAFDTFRQFDCVTCHDARPNTPDLIHVGLVAGYVSPPASADCLRCHPTGTSVMADHGRFFPIGAGTPHNLGCSQCHAVATARSDLSKQQCHVCHVTRDAAGLASAHSSSAIGTDFTASEACGGASATTCPQSCLRCHADGQVNPVSGHPSFDGRRLPHEEATCLQCHDAPLRTDLVASPVPPNTTPVPYAADFASDPADCAKLSAQKGCFHCHNTCPPD